MNLKYVFYKKTLKNISDTVVAFRYQKGYVCIYYFQLHKFLALNKNLKGSIRYGRKNKTINVMIPNRLWFINVPGLAPKVKRSICMLCTNFPNSLSYKCIWKEKSCVPDFNVKRVLWNFVLDNLYIVDYNSKVIKLKG